MKKIPRKLVFRSETLRTLDNIDLVRARGGGDSADADLMDRTQSGINCVAQPAVPTPK
jgi:hypothetical protein